MKLLFENWREYQRTLEEAMADLKAVKQKYAEDPLMMKVVDVFEKNDPSDNHKYIQWMVKQANMSRPLDPRLKDPEMSWKEVTKDNVEDILDVVKHFHKFSKKASIWKDLPRDISAFKKIKDLKSEIEVAKEKVEKAQKEKEAAAVASKQAKEESDVVYDDNEFMVIRPSSKHASCYFGRGTKWCISATDSGNYYESYTEEGKVFYFVMDKKRSNDDPYKKVAWVGNSSGEFEEYFDTVDNSIGYDLAIGQIDKTNSEKSSTIEEHIHEHLSDNLPRPPMIEQAKALADEANARMDHTEVDVSADEWGEYQSMESWARTTFKIPTPLEWATNPKLAQIWRADRGHGEMMDDEVYHIINDNTMSFSFEIGGGGNGIEYRIGKNFIELNVELIDSSSIYEKEDLINFLHNIESEVDDKNDELSYAIQKGFVEQELLPPSPNDKVAEELENEKGAALWDNVSVTHDTDDGGVQYDFMLDFKVKSAINSSEEKLALIRNTIRSLAKRIYDVQSSQLEFPGMETDRKYYEFPTQNVGLLFWTPRSGTKLQVTSPMDSEGAKATYEVMKIMNKYPKQFQKAIASKLSGENINESKKHVKILIRRRKK